MKFQSRGKIISGILSVLPSREIAFDDEISNYNFSEAQCRKLKKIMGFDKHRIVADGVCASDLAVHGMEYLFSEGILTPSSFDAMVVVTQSPDYFMPPTSNVIQGRLNLSHEIFCMDINQGCAGFVIGLIQAHLLLDQPFIDRVVLINVDVLSKKTSKFDRNSFPLIGDGAAITIVEKSNSDFRSRAIIKMDGTRCESLMIPAGGFRKPCDSSTSELKLDNSGNSRSEEHLVMKGDAVFNFVQTDVPTLIKETLEYSNFTLEEIDYYLFHQPNQFMLNKLADKLRIPHEKMPHNVVANYGNGSGITIPLAITHNLQETLENKKLNVCFSGFGVGLTWATMITQLGPLKFCRQIEY